MNHIFGPVNSRRLGRSLGVDLFLSKICDLDCIYCEVGKTVELTCNRKYYVPVDKIIEEITEYCSDPERLASVDAITVTASGEPTLHAGLGEILIQLKKLTRKRIIVLTNGTKLNDKSVRNNLQNCDLLIPSLDTVRQESFRRLNRPASCLDLETIVKGIISFSHEFIGELWLELLFVKGVNDSKEDLNALCEIIPHIRADRIQLNSVARPPLEKFALPVSNDFLRKTAELISGIAGPTPVDILTTKIKTEKKVQKDYEPSIESKAAKEIDIDKILNMLKRRPCTAKEINMVFQLGNEKNVSRILESLAHTGRLVKIAHDNENFFHKRN